MLHRFHLFKPVFCEFHLNASFVSNDIENNKYTFENLSTEMMALKEGDLFAFSTKANDLDDGIS